MEPGSHAVTWQPGLVLPPEKLTPDVIAAIKGTLFPAQVVGLTAWAEARSRFEKGKGWLPNPIDAMVDVINVVHNRATDARWQVLGHAGVCLQRWQFSCWEPTGGPDDPYDPDKLAENFEALMARAQFLIAGKKPSEKLASCIDVAESFLDGRHENVLPGATHYYATWITAPTWTRPPAECVIERYGHRVFRNVV